LHRHPSLQSVVFTISVLVRIGHRTAERSNWDLGPSTNAAPRVGGARCRSTRLVRRRHVRQEAPVGPRLFGTLMAALTIHDPGPQPAKMPVVSKTGVTKAKPQHCGAVKLVQVRGLVWQEQGGIPADPRSLRCQTRRWKERSSQVGCLPPCRFQKLQIPPASSRDRPRSGLPEGLASPRDTTQGYHTTPTASAIVKKCKVTVARA